MSERRLAFASGGSLTYAYAADTVTGAGNDTGLESDTVTGETIDDDFVFDAAWVNVRGE